VNFTWISPPQSAPHIHDESKRKKVSNYLGWEIGH
jgi:hypothetical protein